MSNIYIQEPPSNGKVLLVTSLGDIDVELWSKEAPKACRNFVQLCMENYYDNTIFHRIVKGFIAQGGDPTGTGLGGESIYGKPFKDEFHQRLRFNRRGLVGMANSGPNSNGSQFFFSLDRADELTKKHTIFAKVGGNTIYNMIRMADLETDEDDRPTDPPRILKTEILYNPFDDMEPRQKLSHEKPDKEDKQQKSKKAPKNFKLLSFGEEAEEDEVESTEISKKLVIKSSHDVLKDPKLSSEPAIDNLTSKNLAEDTAVNERIREKLTKKTEIRKRERSSSPEDEEDKKKRERRKALQDEAKQLKRELVEKKRKKENDVEELEEKDEKKEEEGRLNDLMEELKEQRRHFIQQKKEKSILKKGGKRENETLALLAGFESQLQTKRDDPIHESKAEEMDESEWMTHQLTFEESERSAKDASIKDADTFDIFDPRNPMTQRRREASKQKQKKR